MRKTVSLLLLLITTLRLQAQYFDTVSIYYTVGDATPGREGEKILDKVAILAKNKKLLIYSYADYLGTEKPNLHLSESRAEGIKRYLLDKGIREEQILQCTGLGQLTATGPVNKEGDYKSRRSDIFIRKERPAPLPTTEKKPAEQPDSGKNTLAGLLTLEVNQTLRMDNIGFYPGRPDVLPSAYPELEELYNTLASHPTLKVRLEGHVCCCVYPDGFFEDTPTWVLSVERAITVYRYLISKGIDAERLQYKGFGRTRPIRDNERTSEEGQVNRRVEVRVLAR